MLDLACIHAAAMGIPEEHCPDVLNGATGFHLRPGLHHKRPKRPLSPEAELRRRLRQKFGPWGVRPDAVFFTAKGNIIINRREALRRATAVGIPRSILTDDTRIPITRSER